MREVILVGVQLVVKTLFKRSLEYAYNISTISSRNELEWASNFINKNIFTLDCILI